MASAAQPNFTGRWKLETNENLYEYLKAMGVGWAKRKLISALGVEQVLKHEGNNFDLVATVTGGKQVAFKIVIGDASGVEYTNLEGKKDTIKMNWEGNALVATVTAERGEAITKRTIQDGKMILATTSKGVTMKRIFKRLE